MQDNGPYFVAFLEDEEAAIIGLIIHFNVDGGHAASDCTSHLGNSACTWDIDGLT